MLSRTLKVSYYAQIARRSSAGFRNKHSWLLLIGKQCTSESKRSIPGQIKKRLPDLKPRAYLAPNGRLQQIKKVLDRGPRSKFRR